MWEKSFSKKIYVLILTSMLFSGNLFANTEDIVGTLAGMSASVVKGNIQDGKSMTASTKETIANEIIGKVSQFLVKKFVIASGKLKLTSSQKQRILIEAKEKMKTKLLPKIKRIKNATPSILADVVVGLVIDETADYMKKLINPTTTAGHFAAEFASYGIKQAKVAWAYKKGGMPAAVLESAVLAGGQVVDAVKLYKQAKKMKKNDRLNKAINTATFKANELRNKYKAAGTEKEKSLIQNKITNLFNSIKGDNKEKLYIQAKSKIYMDALKVADKRKFYVLDNLKMQIEKNPENAKAYTQKALKFIRNNFNDVDNQYMSTEGNYAKKVIDNTFKKLANSNLVQIEKLINKAEQLGGIKNLSNIEKNKIINLAQGIDPSLKSLFGDNNSKLEIIMTKIVSYENQYSQVYKANIEKENNSDNPLIMSSKEEGQIKPKSASNPNLKDTKNGKNLKALKTTDKSLKDKIKGLKDKQDKLTTKENELRRAKDRLANTNKYNTVQVNNNTKSYDNRKVNYLEQARSLTNKYKGKSFQSWSKADKVSMGIIARNLNIATKAKTITKKGQFLNSLLKYQGLALLKEKYASYNTPTTRTRAEYNYDYQKTISLINILENEVQNARIDLKNQQQSIKRLEAEKNQLMSSINDTVDDYLNNTKTQTPLQAKILPIDKKDWRGAFTFKAETQSEKIVYSGGDWGTTQEHLQDGASELFTFDSNNQDIVTGGYFEHGENSATDNTKQFNITANGSNTNIKNLNITQNVGNGNQLSFKTTGHYDYTVWGEWKQTGGLYTNINNAINLNLGAGHSHWIVGQVTKDLPSQGSATYSGTVNGAWYQSGNFGDPNNRPQYGGKIHGTINMTVNFTNTSIVSGALNLKKENGNTFANTTMDQMQISRNSKAFAGRLIGSNLAPLHSHIDPAGTSYNNQINGSFYGPNAEEVGGAWKVSNSNNNYASGTFAGKR